MEQRTHLSIDTSLVGEVLELAEGRARVALRTRKEMAADERGLVHGGFPFGLADYAAMVAVNDPNVVLGGAEVRFTSPVRTGQTVIASAEVMESAGRKRVVRVTVEADGTPVLEGTFQTFVLDRHVFDK
jgi:uncharacterized protein (TIGR00369 family)